mgnify:CR=1 FL=1
MTLAALGGHLESNPVLIAAWAALILLLVAALLVRPHERLDNKPAV